MTYKLISSLLARYGFAIAGAFVSCGTKGKLAMELTKANILALKTCNDVVFRYIDGKSTIEAIKRVDDKTPFEQIHIIECGTSTVIYGYDYDGSYNYEYEIEKAFAMNSCSRSCGLWKTIAGLLRVGDELALFWKAGAGNNGYLEPHGLVCDHLELVITRGKDKEMRFLVEANICEKNSARMCQVRRKKDKS